MQVAKLLPMEPANRETLLKLARVVAKMVTGSIFPQKRAVLELYSGHLRRKWTRGQKMESFYENIQFLENIEPKMRKKILGCRHLIFAAFFTFVYRLTRMSNDTRLCKITFPQLRSELR